MRNRSRAYYFVWGGVSMVLLIAGFAVVVGATLMWDDFSATWSPVLTGRSGPDYIVSTLYYPGAEFRFVRDDEDGALPEPVGASIEFRKLDEPGVELIDSELGKFPLAPHLGMDEVTAWAGERGSLGRDGESIEIGSTRLIFSHGKLIRVEGEGCRLQLTKHGQELSWPCSKEKLEVLLGKPHGIKDERFERRMRLHP